MESHRYPSFREWQAEATAFLHEIVMAGDCLRDARSFDGEPAMHYGPRWQLLRVIERCGGAPTFSDLGRLLHISKQAARSLAIKTADRGLVEIFPSHDDRRALQVMLTPVGRRALEAQRVPNTGWLSTLLNGLDPVAMRETYRVLHVIRQRLERYARELSAASARR